MSDDNKFDGLDVGPPEGTLLGLVDGSAVLLANGIVLGSEDGLTVGALLGSNDRLPVLSSDGPLDG